MAVQGIAVCTDQDKLTDQLKVSVSVDWLGLPAEQAAVWLVRNVENLEGRLSQYKRYKRRGETWRKDNG